jgi:predicted PhzF superfamily epimerase YddE/YHI9
MREGMVILQLVDAFAERPFVGNPAAVCVLSEPRTDAWMQQVAFELGYSETAYVTQADRGFSLRWFTPKVEVKLCGHATLASAHVLWSMGRAKGPITFQTLSGELTCEQERGMIYLDLPRKDAQDEPPPVGLLPALRCRNLVATKRVDTDVLIELADEASVLETEPDFRALAQVAARAVMITAPSADPAFDFVSRFFAPAAGVDEDPVTGSAHCALTPYWAERFGKTRLRARQLSARGGVVEAELRDQRVRLGGRATTVLTGTVVV